MSPSTTRSDRRSPILPGARPVTAVVVAILAGLATFALGALFWAPWQQFSSYVRSGEVVVDGTLRPFSVQISTGPGDPPCWHRVDGLRIEARLGAGTLDDDLPWTVVAVTPTSVSYTAGDSAEVRTRDADWSRWATVSDDGTGLLPPTGDWMSTEPFREIGVTAVDRAAVTRTIGRFALVPGTVAVVFAFGVWAFGVRRAIDREVDERSGVCGRCGYPRGASDTCTECGYVHGMPAEGGGSHD